MKHNVVFDEFGPEKILEVYDPKNGMRGLLVIDNTALGPGKGGIRMTPTVTVEEVVRLARTMTWKCALAELPFVGAKSGIVADPKSMQEEDKMDLVSSFALAVKPLSPSHYVTAPDMNTGEVEMAVYVLANGSLRSCTGKPSHMCVKPGKVCGIPHEYGSTGLGVANASVVALQHISLEIKGATIAIQGFGNVGSFTAKFLSDLGAKIVAVSDSRGGIYNVEGLDFGEITRVKRETGTVITYKPSSELDNEELIELPVDILIPAATPDVINKGNVDKIAAKVIVEAANIPATPEIEEKLYFRGILVVPDFVANAGGVISSYAEYMGRNPEDMYGFIEKKIRKITKLILDRSKVEEISPREAAQRIAEDRVRKAMKRKNKM